MGFGVLLSIALLVLAMVSSGRLMRVFFFDAFDLLIPLFFTGNVKLWTPAELSMKLGSFRGGAQGLRGGW
jgi:hypothetical protein